MANPIYGSPNFSTTLNVGGGINNSQTTGIILTSVSGLNTGGGILGLTWSTTIDTLAYEEIEYTGISGNELTGVTRGVAGTSGKAHLNQATVVAVISSIHHNRHSDKLRSIDAVLSQDPNNNEIIKTGYNASAVNEVTVTNAATGNAPSIAATGGDTNIDINIVTKGSGVVKFNGVAAPTSGGILSTTQYGPQGFLINGKIVPSVASSDLTVAIKGMDGNDPSVSNPVYCRIGDTVRTITSALSVTKNDGTNWFDSGGAELATLEVDYFVYLGYNATDGVVVGFSRIPWATKYGDFSATSTNPAYAAISTITTANSADYYENIGRFAATLSAGAGYTWTVPSFTAINLIQQPVYETRWAAFTTVDTGFSSVPTSVTTKYKIRGAKGSGEMIAFRQGTAGGTSNSTGWTMTLPYPVLNGNFFTGYKKDNSGAYGMAVNTSSASSKTLTLYAGTGLGDGWTASGNKNSIFPETIFQLA